MVKILANLGADAPHFGTGDEVKRVFAEADADGSGLIGREEFADVMLQRPTPPQPAREVLRCFKLLAGTKPPGPRAGVARGAGGLGAATLR